MSTRHTELRLQGTLEPAFLPLNWKIQTGIYIKPIPADLLLLAPSLTVGQDGAEMCIRDSYKLDFSELPVLLCGFYLGPSATVICEGVKILLKLLLKGTSTAFVGDLANFVVGCSLVLPATVFYHTHKSKHSAIIGLAIGTLVMTVFGSAFNAVYLLPKFAQLYGIPLDTIIAMGTAIRGGRCV